MKTNNKKNMKFHKLNYTSLSMNENELLGGFSFAFTHQEEFQEDPANPNICQTINNCNGGNCTKGCG